MASDWELGLAMGFGFGMAGLGPASVAPSPAHAAQNYAVTANSPAYAYGLPSADTPRVDDLLGFSNHGMFFSSSATADNHAVNSQLESPSTYHSHSRSFTDDIYIPSEEAAELEWLSKFVEDSFSEVPYPPSYLPANPHTRGGVDPTAAVPAARGSRSKRSRVQSSSSSSTSSSSSSSDLPPPAHLSGGSGESAVRRCTHCASEKTPQWRTGPLGPKTLCNACGVRYKSGRLVPEYRPAASPTFVLSQHSNSHRKVVELRRQKEQLHPVRRESQTNAVAAASRPEIVYQN